MTPRSWMASWAFLLAISCCVQAMPGSADGTAARQDLSAMSIEDLMNVKVISVARNEEKLSRTASAVFVINREDIRDSGALNIPDLLRMVPGMDVAQITANTWAVATRGLNSRFSNKLLVLLDGRRVYSPTIGGVFWDVLDVPLDNIERIEVIRGPGGSVWGANAVDGVINIITKKASETTGGLVTAGGGTLAQGFGTVQYGGNFSNGGEQYRVFTKYQNNGHLANASGQNGGDGWQLLDGGFRLDSTLPGKNTLMTQGGTYTGQENMPAFTLPSMLSPNTQFVDFPVHLSGGYLQSVWTHAFSSRSDTALDLSYDAYQRNDALREGRKTLTLDFQHHLAIGERQNFQWGFTYQYTSSHSDGNLLFSLNPPDLNVSLFSCFLQDEIALIPERLYVTVGSKFDENPYSGWSAMPSVRLAWRISRRTTVWAAYSSPDRTPNENDVAFDNNFAGFLGGGGIPVLVGLRGTLNPQNEGADATEVGYRSQLSNRFSIDIAAYYNHYTHLQTIEPAAPFLESYPAPTHRVIPMRFDNLMYGKALGVEVSGAWRVARYWTLSPGYAFEGFYMHLDPASQDTTSVATAEGSSPRHSAQLRSRVDLSHGFDWNASAYFVGRLPTGNIPAYTRIDAQLTWHWGEQGTISLVGQNLQQDHHLEFVDFLQSIVSTRMKRSGYAEVRWTF